jgi:hypothetical protein
MRWKGNKEVNRKQMANEKAILIQDLIAEVAGEMSLPVTLIYAKDEKGYNVEFGELAQRDMPVLACALEQRGLYDIQETGKVYLQYSTTLLFLDFTEDNKEDALDKINAMHLVAVEFMQRLIRLDAFSDVFSNKFISPTFQELAFIFDPNVSGVQLDFNIKIDPNILTPAC